MHMQITLLYTGKQSSCKSLYSNKLIKIQIYTHINKDQLQNAINNNPLANFEKEEKTDD